MAISMDLRVRIHAAREAGETTAEVAERFAVCPAFVRRLMQRFRETGSLAPKTGPRGPKPGLRSKHERIRAHVAAHPDHSPAEVREHLGLDASVSTVRRAFVALGLTFKKSR
jgi:transposase